MRLKVTTDLDFLSARLHGRRSRMAEGERLDSLCRLRTIPELARTLFPEANLHTAIDLQRCLVLDVLLDIESLAARVEGPASDVLDWLALRFQMENLRVLVRAYAGGMTIEEVRPHLVPLSDPLAMRPEPFLAAGSIEAFAATIPAEPLAKAVLRLAVEPFKRTGKPFYVEAALDHGYLTELIARTRRMTGDDGDLVLTIARQEADMFNLMLVARGVHVYRVKGEELGRYHVRGGSIYIDEFQKMARATDLSELAQRSVGRALDAVPVGLQATGGAGDVGLLEAASWNRFYRVANRVFRMSHMGVAAVVAYTALRRVELANLITVSEGIRANVAPEALRRRMIPRASLEAARV